jgi:hypothetical protein
MCLPPSADVAVALGLSREQPITPLAGPPPLRLEQHVGPRALARHVPPPTWAAPLARLARRRQPRRLLVTLRVAEAEASGGDAAALAAGGWAGVQARTLERLAKGLVPSDLPLPSFACCVILCTEATRVAAHVGMCVREGPCGLRAGSHAAATAAQPCRRAATSCCSATRAATCPARPASMTARRRSRARACQCCCG